MSTWAIPIVVDADTLPAESKSLLSRGATVVRAVIDGEKIRENVAKLAEDLQKVAAAAVKSSGEFELSEIEAGIEISADGGVSLIGTVKAGATASIKLTFARK